MDNKLHNDIAIDYISVMNKYKITTKFKNIKRPQ